jgi:hypothetical protein
MDDLDEQLKIDSETAATHTADRRYVTMRAIMHEVMIAVSSAAVIAAVAAIF